MNKKQFKKFKKETKRIAKFLIPSMILLGIIRTGINRTEFLFFDFGYKDITVWGIPDL